MQQNLEETAELYKEKVKHHFLVYCSNTFWLKFTPTFIVFSKYKHSMFMR